MGLQMAARNINENGCSGEEALASIQEYLQ